MHWIRNALLVGLLVVTWYYPLNRTRYERVQRLLARRHRREARRKAGDAGAVPVQTA